MISDVTLAVPAYFHPRTHPADWARLAALGPLAGAGNDGGRESGLAGGSAGGLAGGSARESVGDAPGGLAAGQLGGLASWPGPAPAARRLAALAGGLAASQLSGQASGQLTGYLDGQLPGRALAPGLMPDPYLGFAVMNPNSGPGTEPDPAYHPVISAVTSTGGRVTGYVDTAYARRPSGAVLRDLAAYRAWYGLSGVFLDQVSSGTHHLAHYRRLVAGARRIGFDFVVLNPGVTPSPGFADLADVLVTFEGEWNAYGDYLVAEWMRGYPRERFCHLIHGGGPTALADARARAAANHVGVLYATELTGSNPWAALCSELLPGVLSLPG